MLPDLSDIEPKHLKIRLIDARYGGGALSVRIFCSCGHVGETDLQALVDRHGPEVTFNHVERMAKCASCGGRRDLDARPVYSYWVGSLSYST